MREFLYENGMTLAWIGLALSLVCSISMLVLTVKGAKPSKNSSTSPSECEV